MTPSQEKYKQRRLAFAEFIKLYPFTTDDLDGEEWRPIEGYEGYQISNFGRVKSFKCNEPQILKPMLNEDNYLSIYLRSASKYHFKKIHRLVAEAFIPNPDNKPQVNHRDGCKINAFVGNLEWATASENMRHAFKTGLNPIKRGEMVPTAKLTNAQALYVRENPDNLARADLAKMFGLTKTAINYIQLGLTYSNIGGHVRAREIHPPNRIPDEIRDQIRTEYIKGDKTYGAKPLGRKYNVDPKTITNIVNEK